MESTTTASSPTLSTVPSSTFSCRNRRATPLSPIIVPSAEIEDEKDTNITTPTTVQTPVITLEEPLISPSFFDLSSCITANKPAVCVETLMLRLMSEEHLLFILNDHVLAHRFATFINKYRPQYASTFVRCLAMQKTQKAVEYANSLASSVWIPASTRGKEKPAVTLDVTFGTQARREVDVLRQDVLSAYVTAELIAKVTEAATADIRGEDPSLGEGLTALGETFCLTNPSMKDNPIVYASEEFYNVTKYGTEFALGRNCRFLQGPGSDKKTTARLAKALTNAEETNEILLNYHGDGTPFINLLMCAPLYDDKNKVKYFLGAQVDVTRLVVEGNGIESFRSLQHNNACPQVSSPLVQDSILPPTSVDFSYDKSANSVLEELTQMLTQEEAVSFSGHDENVPLCAPAVVAPNAGACRGAESRSVSERVSRARQMIEATSHHNNNTSDLEQLTKRQIPHSIATASSTGVYQNYLLIHPYPSLCILFVSPSLRIPGLQRSPLFSKIGGSPQALQSLSKGLRGRSPVTAKVEWLPDVEGTGPHFSPCGKVSDDNKDRYLRATPLIGTDDKVGAWMCVFVPAANDEAEQQTLSGDSESIDVERLKQRIGSQDLEQRPISPPDTLVDDTAYGRSSNEVYREKRRSEIPKTSPERQTLDSRMSGIDPLETIQNRSCEWQPDSSNPAVEAWLHNDEPTAMRTSWLMDKDGTDLPFTVPKWQQDGNSSRKRHNKRLTRPPRRISISDLPIERCESQSPPRSGVRRASSLSGASKLCNVNLENYPAQFVEVSHSTMLAPIIQSPASPRAPLDALRIPERSLAGTQHKRSSSLYSDDSPTIGSGTDNPSPVPEKAKPIPTKPQKQNGKKAAGKPPHLPTYTALPSPYQSPLPSPLYSLSGRSSPALFARPQTPSRICPPSPLSQSFQTAEEATELSERIQRACETVRQQFQERTSSPTSPRRLPPAAQPPPRPATSHSGLRHGLSKISLSNLRGHGGNRAGGSFRNRLRKRRASSASPIVLLQDSEEYSKPQKLERTLGWGTKSGRVEQRDIDEIMGVGAHDLERRN